MRHPTPLTVTIALSAVALVSYSAFRALSDRDDAPVRQPAGAAATAATPVLPDALPDFRLDDLDGVSTSIENWPGRPLLINFWATWCAPCLREIPLLKGYQQESPDVQVVGIAVDRAEPVAAFAETMQFNYPVLVGQAEAMGAAAAFGVDVLALPFTVFTSSEGATLGVHTGELHEEHLENLQAVLEDLDRGTIDLEAARARIAGRR
jgi:thiol-disulfide isomerase/thioredoxin